MTLVDIDKLIPSPLRTGKIPEPPNADIDLAKKHGIHVLPSVVARKSGGGEYEILQGLRTWIAAQRIGEPAVPVSVMEIKDTDAAELVRRDLIGDALDVIAEAECLHYLVEVLGYSKAEAGRKRQTNRSVASKRMTLLNLPNEVKQMLSVGQIQENHGLALVGVKDRKLAVELAHRVAHEGLSVRALREMVKTSTSSTPKATSGPDKPLKDPSHLQLEAEMSEIVGSPVVINCDSSGTGELRIRFYDLDVLDGILERLGKKAWCEDF